MGGLFIKLIPWSALSINFARCSIALLVKIALRRSVRIRFNRSTVSAGICFALTTTFFALANKYTTSANAILLQYTAPVFIILVTWLRSRRRPRALDLTTCALILAGVALCFLDSLGAGGTLGNIFGLIAGFSFGMMLYLNGQPGASPDDANMIGFLLATLVGFPFIIRETVFTPNLFVYALILGAFQLGLAYVLLEYGQRRLSPLTVTFLSALEPVLNPIWVAVFYGETIGIRAIAGGVIVLGASCLYSALNAHAAQQNTV